MSRVAVAQSQLFVLVDDKSQLADVGALIDQLSVPVTVLDLGRLNELTKQVVEPLSFVNQMERAAVLQKSAQITAIGQASIAQYQDGLNRTYRDQAVAGEIATRYGVTQLPTLIEITAQGQYRKVTNAESFESGVLELEGMSFRVAPPPITHTRSASRSARAVIPLCSSVAAEPCIPVTVTMMHNGVARERLLGDVLSGDDLLAIRIDPDGIQRIIDANPDIVLSSPAELTEFLSRQASDQRLPDEESVAIVTRRSTGNRMPIVGSGTQYSVLDAILDGSSPTSFDCFELKISGVCLYYVVRVYCFIGCTVQAGPEASLELTHYNPELLVASYKRLGASPLQEARALFGALQNTLSGAAIGVMTGVDVPAEYDDAEKWAAWTSETKANGAAPSTLKYHEIDAIGHPGTLYAHINASGLDPLPRYLASLLEGPDNLVDGIKTSVRDIPPSLQEQSDVVDSITNSLPTPSPVTAGGLGSFVGSMQRPSGSELLAMAQSRFPDSIADAAVRLLGLSGAYETAVQAWELANTASITALTDSISATLDTREISTELQVQIDKANEILALIDATGAGFEGVGAGVSGTDLFSMCPGANEFLKPYLLSGLDMTQWKFNIPEIVFAQTYAPPLPAFNDLYVGDLSFVGDDGLQVPNAWGSIYPRQGFVNQPDEMKAAAVAGSRAAHVITRAGQKHVYSPLIRPSKQYLNITHPPPFSPVDKVSGKWQQLVPELDEQCYVFGQDDRVLRPWTRDRQTEDRAYVFALWRQYACCPEPKKQGAAVMVSRSIGTIPLDIDLLN